MTNESRIRGLVRLFLPCIIILTPLFWPEAAYAHAFGIQYTLPIPLFLYLWGGAAAVVLSFIIVGLFITQRKEFNYPKLILPKFNLSGAGKWVGFSFFLLTIVTGLFGTNEAIYNFNMTFFWIIFLLGLTYLTALIGDIWPILNPWGTLIEIFENISKKSFKGVFNYPEKLGFLPALTLYFLLIWTELISRVGPFGLSIRILIFTFLAVFSAFLFGKEIYLKYFDFFGLFFSLISLISPIQRRAGKLYLQPPFVRLVEEKLRHYTLVPFIVFMLSSTAFDGFHSTQKWFNWEFAHLENLEQIWGGLGFIIVQSLALAGTLALFLGLYLGLIFLMKAVTKTKAKVRELSLDFAPSLIPIALVYNIAHYYTLLLIQGQSIISLISDPFGLNWNLFGTADFKPNIGIIGAKFIWNSQVGFILFGHIVAVYLAHLIALRIFPKHKLAFLSQFPMLALMVCYTVAGLWILAQPLTGG